MRMFLLSALTVFGLSSMAQVSGSYSAGKSGLGCFGDDIGGRFKTNVQMEIGEFNGDTAARKLTLELRGVSYPINCTVVYTGQLRGAADGRFFGGLSWENPGGSCSCNVPGGQRQCKRRIDPFLKEKDGQELRVVANGNGITIEQLREPPKSDKWPCGDGYPELKFSRK